MAEGYESPGRALADQATFERRLGRELEVAARNMLAQVVVLARGHELHAATARVIWLNEVGAALTRLGVEPGTDAHAYLLEQVDSGLGDDAYDEAVEAIRVSQGPDDLERTLQASLSLDGVSLVAAAAPKAGPTWRERVRRVVRTAATGLQGVVTQKVLGLRGIPTKQWITRRDDKVRDSHAAVDGKVVALDAPFMVGGYPLMYPGDRNGPVGETANCRCVIVSGRR